MDCRWSRCRVYVDARAIQSLAIPHSGFARGKPEQLLFAPRGSHAVKISARGNRLAFVYLHREVDIWSISNGTVVKHPISSTQIEYNPMYSPDGKRIVFESQRSGSGEIWVANADGSGLLQVTSGGLHSGTPRWSPDGQWIVYDHQDNESQFDIYVVAASGGQPRQLTRNAAQDVVPSFSSDGKWVYFRSDRTGRNQIFRIPFDGGLEQQITTDGGDTAFESADGASVYFLKNTNSPIFKTDVRGGTEVQMPIRVNFRAFHVTTDGIYFLRVETLLKTFEGVLGFHSFTTGKTVDLHRMPGFTMSTGLTVAPDRKTFLVAKAEDPGADLMLVEGFQ